MTFDLHDLPEIPTPFRRRPDEPGQKTAADARRERAMAQPPVMPQDTLRATQDAELRQQADALWRNWLPTRDDRVRPRRTTFLKRLRKEREDAMKQATPKADGLRKQREARAAQSNRQAPKGSLSSPPKVEDEHSQPQPSGPVQPEESTMKTSANQKPASRAKSKSKSTARRAVKSTAARTPKAKAPREPKGMVVEILKLSSRENGVSPAQLNELTKWKGAPWKWLFSNPKKTGYCDRWNYSFKVIDKDGETRYKTEKKA